MILITIWTALLGKGKFLVPMILHGIHVSPRSSASRSLSFSGLSRVRTVGRDEDGVWEGSRDMGWVEEEEEEDGGSLMWNDRFSGVSMVWVLETVLETEGAC